MSRKNLLRLKAGTVDGGVALRCYLGEEPFTAVRQQIQQKGSEAATVRIRLFRQEQPEYTFNRDYEEFFDALTPSEADLLFEGELCPSEGRKIEYLDRDVAPYKTYCYWIAYGDDWPPVGPAAVRVRDARVWWPFSKLQQRVEALSSRESRATAEALAIDTTPFGQTAQRRPMLAARVGNRQRCIALAGAVHPGESGPELILPVLERLIAEESALLQKVGIAILPSVAADERERLVSGHPPYLRHNANGVDLNRNFPASWEEISTLYGLNSADPDALTYRGPFAGSEPETQAVIAFMEAVQPQAVFSFHCLASLCTPPFLGPEAGGQDAEFVAQSRRLTMAYCTGFYGESDAQLGEPRFAASSGSLPHWLWQRRVPAFDLEFDRKEESAPCVNDLTTPEMITTYAERHFHGVRAVLAQLAADC